MCIPYACTFGIYIHMVYTCICVCSICTNSFNPLWCRHCDFYPFKYEETKHKIQCLIDTMVRCWDLNSAPGFWDGTQVTPTVSFPGSTKWHVNKLQRVKSKDASSWLFENWFTELEKDVGNDICKKILLHSCSAVGLGNPMYLTDSLEVNKGPDSSLCHRWTKPASLPIPDMACVRKSPGSPTDAQSEICLLWNKS